MLSSLSVIEWEERSITDDDNTESHVEYEAPAIASLGSLDQITQQDGNSATQTVTAPPP